MSNETELRTAADTVLARLVGRPRTAARARLREDQWRAIEALVADKRRGAGGAAHRLGQVGGVLRRHRAAAASGAAGPR